MIRRALPAILNSLSLEQKVTKLAPTAWFDATETYAKSKIAVDLDGTADYLSGGDLFNADGTDKPCSFSIWFKVDAASNNNYILADNVSANDGLYIGTDAGNTLYYRIWDDSNNAYLGGILSATITTGNWFHIVVTYDGLGVASGLKLYVNGSLAQVGSITSGTFAGLEAKNYNIGADIGGARYANITIDQAISFDDELSSTEVSELYNSYSGLNHKDLTGSETFYNNIVAWYDFNRPSAFGQDFHTGGLDLTPISITSANATLGHIEGKAAGFDGTTRWTDRSGNGNDLTQDTLADVPSWLENQANGFGGVDFTNTAFLKSANTLNMDGYAVTSPSSFFFAFRVTDVNSVQYFYINGNQLRVGISSGRFWFVVYDDTGDIIGRQTPTSVLSINTLHTIAVTYDGTGATNGDSAIKLYLDGSETATATFLTTGVFNNNYGASNYSYDSWFADAGGSSSIRGDIYQGLFFEDRLLEASEVQTIHNFCAEKYGL